MSRSVRGGALGGGLEEIHSRSRGPERMVRNKAWDRR